MKTFLEIGKVVTTHGIKGEVKLQPWCDSAEELKGFPILYLDDKGEQSLEITLARTAKDMAILKIQGIDTIEAGEALRGKVLFIRRSDAKLTPGEYFIQDLIGLTVVDADSPQKVYGILADISPTGANDVYHIQPAVGEEVLIPAIKQVVIRVDLEEERMYIRPLPGLLDDLEGPIDDAH